MLKKVLIVLAVLVVILVVVTALQPSEFHVARATTVAAPAPVVFAQVNDFHKWEAWNPWARIDPTMKQEYQGSPAGVGAVYTWVGNSEVGEGRMTVVESRPSDLIRVKLEFFKPMAGESVAEFTFTPDGDRTAVTWSMSGRNNFIAKAMCLVMNMDKMIGGQFEKGLAQMRVAAEAAAKG